jgi:hypothetical protein
MAMSSRAIAVLARTITAGMFAVQGQHAGEASRCAVVPGDVHPVDAISEP